ncbi:MAG: hypothetical protein KGI11_09515, partial [Thaumarchaeota archaeon]|nr:hypothetical protein [Nitrososphaerota archaeon]
LKLHQVAKSCKLVWNDSNLCYQSSQLLVVADIQAQLLLVVAKVRHGCNCVEWKFSPMSPTVTLSKGHNRHKIT